MIPLAVFLVALGILFFAVVETAFGVLMRLPRRLEAEREAGNEALASYLDDPLTLFVPARLLRGLLVLAAIILLVQPIGGGLAAALTLFGAGALITIGFGLLLPAVIVRQWSAERVLDVFLPPFTAVAAVTAPVTAIIIGWLGTELRPALDRDDHPADQPAEPEPGEPPHSGGVEGRLLRSVVDFGDTLVREVMTPRPDIVAISAEATIDDLRRLVREQEYSRLPVFSENLDNIVGLVVVKDLIQMADPPEDSSAVTAIMRPAAFVPETKRVADLLREFQRKRFHLAIVVDEYGGTAGLVTVEDLVEEIVGEIRDEYDLEAEPIVQESDGVFVFSAKVGIEKMTDRLGVEIEGDGFETVGGYVLARAGRVPAPGERLSADGLEIEVLEAERRRIHKVRVRAVPRAEADEES